MTMNKECKYNKEAKEFAKKVALKLSVIGDPIYGKHFIEDKDCGWIFKMRLSRNNKSYTFNFGQSIAEGCKIPTMYDVLACLQKHEVGSLEDFIDNFGYEYSKDIEKLYKAVCKEHEGVMRVLGDVIEKAREIY